MKRLIFLLLCLMLSSNMIFAQAAPDRDGDGVPDSDDDCISQVGTRANDGCPERPASTNNPVPQHNPDDNDGDGTNNSADACPESGGPDWNAGCPVEEVEEAAASLNLPTDGNCVMASQSNSNRRSLPAMNADVLGIVPAGEFYPVLALLHNVQEGTSWYQTSPNSFVNADIVLLGGNCRGVVRFDFDSGLASWGQGLAFVYERLDILFHTDPSGTHWISARPHEPVEPIDWLTMDEPEAELGIQVAIIPDPVDPLVVTIVPEGESPLSITMGPIVDPSPGIILDVTEPEFNTCTFTDFWEGTNAAASRKYYLLQEKMGWDYYHVFYGQIPFFFWENVLMTEDAYLHFAVLNDEATGQMRASLGDSEVPWQFAPDDEFEVEMPTWSTLTPNEFDGLHLYEYQLTISNYTVPIILDIRCIEINS